MDKPFVLYASCIPVKGFKQSVIVDIHRQNIFHIPNSLYDLLNNHKSKTIKEIKDYYKNQYSEIIDDYFNFLVKNDIVFFTNEPNSFPELDLTWKSPFEITNCIIDIDRNTNHNYENIFKKLREVSCPHLQIRSFSNRDINYFVQILELLEDSNFLSVELIIKHSDTLAINEIEKLVKKYPRIFNIIIHSAPETSCILLHPEKMGNIFYSSKNISSPMDCGCISSDNFVINTKTFTESLNYNSCLNRKISIDCNGYIKNCPSLKKDFGNIDNVSLQEIIKQKELQKYWNIKKDSIKVCSDCEYRYICTDCRAIIKDINDIYSQPAKCSYNPYIAKWKGEEGFITVEEWQTNNKQE